MTKDDLSTASWIANLGLAVAVALAFAGIPVAGALVPGDDEAAVSGIIGGAIAGLIIGGVIVGALCRRAGLSSRVPLMTICTAPGTLVSLPLLGAIVLAREWQSLPWIAVLPIISTLAVLLGVSSVARLRWR